MTPEEWVLSTPTILTVAGLDFTVHNAGQHIIVHHPDKHGVKHEYHLWPSTGKWRHFHPDNGWGIGTGPNMRIAQRFVGVRGLVLYIQRVVGN